MMAQNNASKIFEEIKLSPDFERALLNPTLEDLIVDANKGNKESAKQLLTIMAYYLNPKRAELNNPTSHEIPRALKEYLQSAFEKMIADESADAAFNFKKHGRHNHGLLKRRLGAYLVYLATTEGQCKLNSAISQATAYLHEQAHHGLLRGSWQCFEKNKLPEEKTLRNWYYEQREYLERLLQLHP